MQYNELQIDQYYPWLATSWSFSTSGLTITFNLRAGVKWDDGSQFNASDVAYTFNLLKTNPSFDPGIPLVSAQAVAPLTFVLTLSRPGYAYLYDIARVPIVKAGYAAGGRLASFTDAAPDGTGPYELAARGDCTPRQVVLAARKDYWQGSPPFQKLVFPAYPTSAAVSAALSDGTLDWAAIDLAGGAAGYLAKGEDHDHFWAPAVSSVVLELNLADPGFDNLSVRRAISDAIDRTQISQLVDGGAGQAVRTLSGLVLPIDQEFLEPSDSSDVTLQGEPGAVPVLMRQAGYHTDAQGYWCSASGVPLGVDIQNAAGSPFATAAGTIAEELAAAGFDASSSAPPTARWHQDLVDGAFEASIVNGSSGPSPFYMYENWLDPALVVGGRALTGDYERFGPATMPAAAAQVTADLGSFTTSLSDSPNAVHAIKALASVVATQLPVIPLVYSAAWGEFSTLRATGWPDGQDPYEPATPRAPFAEYTVLQLSATTAS